MLGVVKYSEEFHTATSHKWLGMELQFDMSSSDPLEVFAKAEKTVKDYMAKSAQSAEVPSPDVQVEKTDRVGDLYNQIRTCTDLTVLDSYKKLIQLLKRPDLMEIYELRRKQIIKKEEQDLIDRADELIQKEKGLKK
jgi:hypothetical protein